MSNESYWYLAHAKDRTAIWSDMGGGFVSGIEPMRFPTAQAALEWATEPRRIGGKMPNVPATYQDKVRIYRHPKPVLLRYAGPMVLCDPKEAA